MGFNRYSCRVFPPQAFTNRHTPRTPPVGANRVVAQVQIYYESISQTNIPSGTEFFAFRVLLGGVAALVSSPIYRNWSVTIY